LNVSAAGGSNSFLISAAAGLLLFAAAIAMYLPTGRAIRVDPITPLQAD